MNVGFSEHVIWAGRKGPRFLYALDRRGKGGSYLFSFFFSSSFSSLCGVFGYLWFIPFIVFLVFVFYYIVDVFFLIFIYFRKWIFLLSD